MFQKIYKLLRRFDEIGCRQCGCKDFDENVTDWINSVEAEREVVCAECGSIENYYAYGSYQWPFTYTESVQRWWTNVLFRWRGRKCR
jgi:hypothetical protein